MGYISRFIVCLQLSLASLGENGENFWVRFDEDLVVGSVS